MKALLVIDMLEDFFEDGHLHKERTQLVSNINKLTGWARSAEIPIYWVWQEFKEDLSDAFLAMRKRDIRITIAGTPGCRTLSELDKSSHDHEIIKKRYSAFFGTSLHNDLVAHDITHVILAGINTHACIRMTAIDAYQHDFEVTIVKDCVSSNDRVHHDVTLAYLSNEIARVSDLAELMDA